MNLPNDDELSALSDAIYGDVDNDASLEAELMALMADEQGIPVSRAAGGMAGGRGGAVARPRPPGSSTAARGAPAAPRGTPAARNQQQQRRHQAPMVPVPPNPGIDPTDPVMNLNFGNIDLSVLDDNYGEDDDSTGVEDDEGLENDPGLLAELQGISGAHEEAAQQVRGRSPMPPPSAAASDQLNFLRNRLEIYQAAEKEAVVAGDGSRARRMSRGVKTLISQVKRASAGQSVSENDIPPMVAVKPRNLVAQAGETVEVIDQSDPQSGPVVMGDDSGPMLVDSGELPPKVTGGSRVRVLPEEAPNFSHHHESVAPAPDNDRRLSAQSSSSPPPPVPPRNKPREMSSPAIEPMPVQSHSSPITDDPGKSRRPSGPDMGAPDPPAARPRQPTPPPDYEDKSAADLFHAPTTAKTPMEALIQRRDKYKSTADQAKAEGNSSKARRMARIQKQYEDAIKSLRAGHPVDFDSLPVPPGFPPIPTGGGGGVKNPAVDGCPARNPPGVSPPKKPATGLPQQGHGQPGAAHTRQPLTKQVSPPSSKYSQQLKFLVTRHHQYREAALVAKKQGNIPLAKKYLVQMKGLEPMIEAAKNGLPVNISHVPKAPKELTDALLKPVTFRESAEPPNRPVSTIMSDQSREEIYQKLEKDLIRQCRICLTNSEYFTKLGEVASAGKFDKLYEIVSTQLMSLKNGWSNGDPAPRFHYEQRKMPSLQCCPDLDLKEMEIQVIRGIQIRPPEGFEPKDMNVFVRILSPLPPDDPFEAKTDSVKGTNSPSFKFAVRTPLNRQSRAIHRALQHKGIKFEVTQKGSFWRSDKSLGVAEVKLAALVSECELHQSPDLMDGRRPCGGKLEVKIRIREPLTGSGRAVLKEEPWAVIDEFVRAPVSRRSAV